MIVRSRIQSVSRWSVAECPCTPTFATRPPGRTSSVQSSNVSGTPTASIATSAPRPSGQLHDSLDARRSLLLLIVTSAPSSRAFSRRGVVEVDRDDVRRREQPRGQDRREPDRARADDRDGVARLDAPVEHADLVRRREDVGEEEHLFVVELRRDLVDRRVGERNAGVLGLEAVDQVAEDPAAAAGAQAVAALLAEPAASAGGDARDEHAVAELERRDGVADFSTIVPTASWPRIVPGCNLGTSPLRMCRSVPQIVDESMRTMASVGASMVGSGTSSQDRCPGP